MSLNTQDLQQIREICREENEALESDVRDIYRIILTMQKDMRAMQKTMQKQMDDNFSSLSRQISSLAAQTGATL